MAFISSTPVSALARPSVPSSCTVSSSSTEFCPHLSGSWSLERRSNKTAKPMMTLTPPDQSFSNAKHLRTALTTGVLGAACALFLNTGGADAALFHFSGQRPTNIGVQYGRYLQNCPTTPNCISSSANVVRYALYLFLSTLFALRRRLSINRSQRLECTQRSESTVRQSLYSGVDVQQRGGQEIEKDDGRGCRRLIKSYRRYPQHQSNREQNCAF